MDTSRHARTEFFQENKEAFKISGCGLSIEEILSGIFGGSQSTGTFGNTMVPGPDGILGEDDFACPACGHVLREKARHDGKCDKCGLTKEKLEEETGVKCI